MSFDPSIRKIKSSLSTSLEHNIAKIQNNFSGRAVMHLPAEEKYRKRWELLGIKWLESLNELFTLEGGNESSKVRNQFDF